MYCSTLLLGLFSALVAAATSTHDQVGSLQAREAHRSLLLQVKAQDDMNDPDDLTVAITLINKGSAAVKILNDPNSVLSTWKTHTFDFAPVPVVRPDGTKAKVGAEANVRAIKLKYSPKIAAALDDERVFTVLQPGENKTIVHDLSGMYSFRTTGAYTVKLASTAESFRVVEDDGSISVVPATVYNGDEAQAWSAINININTNTTLPKREPVKPRNINTLDWIVKREAVAQTTNCSQDQTNQLIEATKVANKYIADANQYLNGKLGERYKTWFGGPSIKRLKRVRSHFQNLAGISQFKFNCKCDEPAVFAYVDPIETSIYPCGAFWNAAVQGSDSKAGTIVHEGTHIRTVAGTEDYAYGPQPARELAKTDGDRATMNADSHEYFAENSPNLG